MRIPDDLELTEASDRGAGTRRRSTPTHGRDGVVALRGWRGDDADRLTQIWQDGELQRRFGVPAPVTGDAIAAWLAGVDQRWRLGLQISLAVTVDGIVVGGCELDDVDTQEPDLGYWVAAPERGRGYATRAARLLVDWATALLPGTALQLVVEADNPASITVAERLGFRRVCGRTVIEDGRTLDVFVRAASSS
jgi:RimJ/RimL family protein N-acetyltransferase